MSLAKELAGRCQDHHTLVFTWRQNGHDLLQAGATLALDCIRGFEQLDGLVNTLQQDWQKEIRKCEQIIAAARETKAQNAKLLGLVQKLRAQVAANERVPGERRDLGRVEGGT